MSPSNLRDYYEELQVSPRACEAVIRAAHRALVQLHHPDKVTDPAGKAQATKKTQDLNNARDVLVDKTQRAEHDRLRAQERQQHSGAGQQPPPGTGGSTGRDQGRPSGGGSASGLRCSKCQKGFKTAGGLEWHRTNNRNCA